MSLYITFLVVLVEKINGGSYIATTISNILESVSDGIKANFINKEDQNGRRFNN